MSAWVPKWKKTGVMPAAAPIKSGVKFIGNATGNTNATHNNGTRYSPKRNGKPVKRTLKAVKHVSPNAYPPAKPGAAFFELPAKFQNMLKSFYSMKPKSPKTRRRRPDNKKKNTRRRHVKK